MGGINVHIQCQRYGKFPYIHGSQYKWFYKWVYQVGFSDQRTSIISTGCLKPINVPFDTGWNFVQYMFDNIIYNTLLLFTMFWDIMRNTSKRIQVLVNNACITTWDLLPKWNTMPLLQRQVKKQYKGSHGARKYSWNLRASKKSCFNKRNCKSGRHNRMQRKVSTLRPTSLYRKAHKICQRVTLTDLSK